MHDFIHEGNSGALYRRVMNINEMPMTLKSDIIHLASEGTAVCSLDFQCYGLGPNEY